MTSREFLILCVLILVTTSCSPVSQDGVVDTAKVEGTEFESIDSGLPFNEVITKTFTNSEIWSSLGAAEKKRVVKTVVDLFKARDNSAVLNPPEFYVERLDVNLVQDPAMNRLPVPNLIKIFAVMEYDFYNGQNKDELARQVLGEKLYEQNRTRREAQSRT